MTQQYTPNLGELCQEDARRDAIHIAVAPVVAGEGLYPGQRVTYLSGEAFASTCTEPTGVVDPFLKEKVKKGDRFWLFLFPGTISSLRHVWSHPSFKVVTPNSSNL